MWSLRPCRVKTLERLGIPEKPSPPLKSSSLHDFYHVTFPVKAGAKDLAKHMFQPSTPSRPLQVRNVNPEKRRGLPRTTLWSHQTHQQTRTHKRFRPSSHLEGLHLKAGPTFSKGPGRGLLHFNFTSARRLCQGSRPASWSLAWIIVPSPKSSPSRPRGWTRPGWKSAIPFARLPSPLGLLSAWHLA